MPVGSIAKLFHLYNGKKGAALKSAPPGLDIACSRSASKIFLHVANLEYRKSIEAAFRVDGMVVSGGKVYEIAPEDLRAYVNENQPDVFQPRENSLASAALPKWRFAPGSVSVVELNVQ